jgi:hypothetical protein
MPPRPGTVVALVSACVTLPFVVAVVALAVTGGAAELRPAEELEGMTRQGREFTLRVDDDARVVSLSTHIRAACGNGDDWGADWTPAEGAPIHFEHEDGSVSARETGEASYPDGSVGQIVLEMRGRVREDAHSGSGHVRLTARFSRGGVQTAACDSGWVAWEVSRAT